MADLETIIKTIDELSENELDAVYRHIVERRHANWWIVDPENVAKIEEILRPVHDEAAQLTEEEINQAITEVRHERKASSGL